MLYTKRKTNKFKFWITRLMQVALILGILFFGYEAINRFTNPTQDSIPMHVVVVQPQVQVIEVQPGNVEQAPALDAEDYFRLGLQHQVANELNEAVLDYSRSIALNENMAASWLNRGVAYDQMGESTRAMYDYLRFIERDDMSVTITSLVTDSVDMHVNVYKDSVVVVPMEIKSGEVVDLSATSVENNLVDTLLVLVDQEGRPVVANDDARRQDGSLISMNSHINKFTVNHGGRYLLLLTHAGGGEYGIHSGAVDLAINIDQ